MSRVALLDVNVLLALFDPGHIHHDVAHDWFADERESGWATCPLTENGFLRTAGVAARSGAEFVSVATLRDGLRKFCGSGHHESWPDDISLMDDRVFNVEAVRRHPQVTDVYLLGLAVKHRGRLVTFDRKVPRAAVKGATTQTLVVLAPEN